MSAPTWAERLVAGLIALALHIVRGVLMAPLIALRRILAPPRVARVPVEAVRPLRHRVLRPGRPTQDAVWPGDDDPTTAHWALSWGGEIVAVLTIVSAPEPTGLPPTRQLRGMAVAPEVQRRGFGARLLQTVQAQVEGPMWCDARTSAEAFYARAGWTAHGEVFDKPGVGPHRRMTWTPRPPPH